MNDTADQKSPISEKRRDSIVAAATEIYLEQGYDGAKMSEIARRANVAEGTLYLYFKNKSDLMLAAVDAHMQRVIIGANQTVRKVDGAFERFRVLADFHLRALVDGWKLHDLRYSLYYAKRSPETERLDRKRNYIAVFNMIFNDGIETGELRGDLSLDMSRDLFYGTLEFSSRYMIRTGKREHHQRVIDELMMLLGRCWSTDGAAPGGESAAEAASDTPDLERLEALTMRLENAVSKLENSS